jgi:hypothetical protein
MKTLLLLLWLLPALAFAQGVVNVNNRGLNPPRLVLGPDGSPLVGTNYVAQILYGPNSQSVTNELGAAMPFRVATTSSPGTWNPGREGIRTVPGFPPGATVWMKVRVWDRSVFPAWPEVLSENSWVPCGFLYGESQPYSVTLGTLDQPSSGSLIFFTGFQLSGWRGGPCNAGIKIFEVRENEPPVFIPESETFFYSSNESRHLTYYDQRVGMLTTTNGGWWFEGRPNAYGLFQQIYRPGVIYTPPSAQEYGGLLIFRVTPSPRRPFLDFALTNSRPSLTLRGLPPRSYRIEGSTNLAGWTRLGELSMGEDGNAPVPDAWLATNATQFVRFVPLPP